MSNPDWINRMFQILDQGDVEEFLAFFTDDAIFRFANSEPVKGKKAIGDGLTDWFKGIKKLSHEVHETWEHPDAVICHGLSTITRHDSSLLTVPFADIFKMDGNLIREYLIYTDNSEL